MAASAVITRTVSISAEEGQNENKSTAQAALGVRLLDGSPLEQGLHEVTRGLVVLEVPADSAAAASGIIPLVSGGQGKCRH